MTSLVGAGTTFTVTKLRSVPTRRTANGAPGSGAQRIAGAAAAGE